MEKNTPDCCKPRKSNGFWQGLLYGLFPHAGCIAFIAASALGMATFASVFRPLLMKGYFFYIMIALSFVFATLSAYLYLKKQGGIKNAKHHKGYLSILYGTTIGISLLMYFVVFPAMASAQFGSSTSNTLAGTSNIPTESELQTQASLEQVTLNVNIPCAGHGPLITGALKEINGVTS
ncbi:MAG: hypothetical protein WC475_04015, partial [Candidatus Paceibacterota bacterium]